MASRGYGPDFGPLLQAIQAYAGQETAQANSRFVASTQLAGTALSAATNIRKWRKEDEDEEILTRTMMDTPYGPTSARQLAALSGASDVVRSMVLSAAALAELKSWQDNAVAVKTLRAGMTPHIGPAADPVAGLARPSTMVPGAVAQPAENPPAGMSEPIVPPETPVRRSSGSREPNPGPSRSQMAPVALAGSSSTPAALAGSSSTPAEASQAVGKEPKPVSKYKVRFFDEDVSDIARRYGIPQESRQVVGEDTKNFFQHEARPYEDVHSIAVRYGVPPRAIRQANGLSSDDIPVGTFVNIPDATWIQAHRNDPQPSKPPAIHVTRPGDDVYTVAIRYGVPVADLKRLNKLEGDEIAPNTRLKIPRAPQH